MPDISMGAFPARHDLVDEIYATVGGGGVYVSEWYDSTEIYRLRVAAYNMSGTDIEFQIQEGQFDSNTVGGNVDPVRIQTLTVDANNSLYAEVELTGRFFLVSVINLTASSNIAITLRKVPN